MFNINIKTSQTIKLPLTALIIAALLGLPAKASLPSTGKERQIYQTFEDESGTCMGFYKKDLAQIDINASKASTLAVVWAAGCGRRCTLTIIGGLQPSEHVFPVARQVSQHNWLSS